MDANYESILLSRPFTFVIGPRKKEFVVHEAAFSRLSESLNALLNGPMREAKEHIVHWEDVDEATFLRFGQWAYSENYAPAEPNAPVVAPQHQPLRPVASSEFCEPYRVVCYQCSKRSGQQRTSCADCLAEVQKGLQSNKSARVRFNTSTKFPSPHDYYHWTPPVDQWNGMDCSEMFLSHAQLYTLADKYDIMELRDLSLHRLWVSLREFPLYPSRIGDITGLIRYAFASTIEGDKLRTLLVDYCACIVGDVLEMEDFKDIFTEIPDFALGLTKKMVGLVNDLLL